MLDFATSEISIQQAHSPAVLPVQSASLTEAAARVDVKAIRTPGLGDTTYILRGIATWRQAGYAVTGYEVVDVPTFARTLADGAAQILDVRSPSEWESGSLPGARWRYVPDLADAVPSDFDATQPVWVLCASGFRASIAAGLLEGHGYKPIVLAHGGVADVLGTL